MSSACGDGWKDSASGEACDDGNALASGGCSATCGAVAAGYLCGEGASGCHLAPVDAGTPAVDGGAPVADAGTPVVDAGIPDAGVEPAPQPAGGCSTAPAPLLLGAVSLWWARRQRR